jgi:hypothetical protein
VDNGLTGLFGEEPISSSKDNSGRVAP